MLKQGIFLRKAALYYGKGMDGQLDSGIPFVVSNSILDRNLSKSFRIKEQIAYLVKGAGVDLTKKSCLFRPVEVKCKVDDQLESSDEDDELCPAECVREFKTDKELCSILEKAKETKSLVVVDFYRTACGSCKYIEQGFAKLCKGSGDQEAPVIFLKHNVIDEYDDQSEVAERLRIRAVPLFHFYKDGVLLEAFPTRDKERITAAIRKYTDLASLDL
ncbi:hypothetical protein RJ639_037462 [Escallonia herrerae]|uniref:Thioredoxin domain-containing protein n=1 Tax=Escallonia herrerae TaxID=1293975 RepID=A0AA88WMA7_9ASTE|nr:hypothetical protein RJ639_037462 [Escallonia herrerae]